MITLRAKMSAECCTSSRRRSQGETPGRRTDVDPMPRLPSRAFRRRDRIPQRRMQTLKRLEVDRHIGKAIMPPLKVTSSRVRRPPRLQLSCHAPRRRGSQYSSGHCCKTTNAARRTGSSAGAVIGLARGETRWRTMTLWVPMERLRAAPTQTLFYCARMYLPSFTVSRMRERSSRPLRSFSVKL
jgi:hypothetical protein